jgi:hypothetical protein
VLNAEQSAHGVIRGQHDRQVLTAAQAAGGAGRQALSTESNRWSGQGRNCEARSNLREAEEAKRRMRSNPQTGATAKCGPCRDG